MDITRKEFEQIIREELEAVVSEKEGPNPWAICTSQVGRGNKANGIIHKSMTKNSWNDP